MKANDALGNEIVIGGNYGYSQSGNGVSTITMGTVVKITESGKVSLKPFHKKTGLYNNKPIITSFGNSVTVKPFILFPVNIHRLKTIE